MLSLDGFTGQAEQALHSASPGLLPARTPQEPERHPGVRPNSASGPLHPEAPLRRQGMRWKGLWSREQCSETWPGAQITEY